jgi:hypothetical protein
MMLTSIDRYLETYSPQGVAPEVAIAASVDFLKSTEALDMLALDPYWPKWDGPWWHMLALSEIGAVEQIPPSALNALLASIAARHLPFFPLQESQLPPDCDPYRGIMCFCALGSVLKLCAQAKLDVFRVIPWAEDWFLTYLLPDGGYNCDEQSYTKATPRSSFTSSLPMYEALLLLKKEDSSSRGILMGGVDYLERREFCKSLSKQCVADPQWLKPGFPLFYEYDALRGMQYAVDVYEAYAESVEPAEPIDLVPFSFAFMAIYEQMMDAPNHFRQPEDYEKMSLRYQAGAWGRAEVGSFDLLQWLKQPAIHQYYVQQRFYTLCKSTKALLLKS